MMIPQGAANYDQKEKVCRLLKGTYGLKQAGRGWHQELTEVFTWHLGFKQLAVDHSIFQCKSNEKHTIVAISTDDIIITSKRLQDIKTFKTEVQCHWDLSDMGKINWYSGFEVM